MYRFKAAAFAAAALLGAGGAPAGAQLFLSQPDFRPGPIEPSDPLVGVPLPGATPAEYRASLLWNLRAGLNVAALSCQFSPYLRAVPNYNGILAHHATELAAAYTTLNNYFKRVQGPVKGQKAFDDYSTVTYNNWSTLQAQMGFCQTASNIEKSALATPKGELYTLARMRMRELRNSLVPAYEANLVRFNPYAIRIPAIPPMRADCWDKKRDFLLARCALG
ncbi:MAG: hypothetical protein JO238_03325 [Alphaproteobacteria bacterium]|nr:hypothetical protein [Alphaproteobacteria bacterium]